MSAVIKGEEYDSYIDRVAQSAGISFFAQGAGRLLGYVTQVALARIYGPVVLGLYVLGTTLVQGANLLAQFGMDGGVVRYVARYQAERDIARVRGTILLTLLVTFALSLVLALLVFLGAGFLANTVFNEPFLETALMAFSVSIPLLTVMNMALWATQGFQTVKYVNYVEQILRPLSNLGLIIAFFLLGMGLLGAVAAYVLSMAGGAFLALCYLRRVFPDLLNWRIPAKYESRAIFSVSGPLTFANVAEHINNWTAVAVLGILASSEAVGIYNAAARTAALSTLMLWAFSGIFSPIVSSLYSRGLLDELNYLYKDVSRWIFTGSLALFMLMVLLSKDIMVVFGNEFLPGWIVLAVVAAAELFNSSVGPTNRILAMTGYQRLLMVAMAGSAVTNLAVSVVLVPLYGILGAAVATAAGVVLGNTVTLTAVRISMNLWPYSYQYLNPLVAGLLASFAILVLRLVLPLPNGVPAIVVLTPVFLAVFLVTLLSLGLSTSDRQFLNAFWAVVRRTARRGV